jgi:hypothetical protein
VVVIGLLSLVALVIVEAQQSNAQTPTLTPQDYIEIQQLVNKYAFALDTCSNNGYDYADLYTSDGIFEWGVGNRRSIGRNQLAEAAARTTARSSRMRRPKNQSRIMSPSTW